MTTGHNPAIYSIRTPQGEYKSLGMHLKDQREQIAREIEALVANTEDVAENFTFDTWNKAIVECAAIARGQK